MRLPVVPNVSTKDGQSNKNARLTNCLKESTKRGDMAVIRPGLVTQAEGDGVGGGLVAFNNELVSVYGATLGTGPTGELNEWTTYTLGTYTIVDDFISTIPNADGVSAFLVFNGHLYRTADGQSIIDVGAIYNNGSGGSGTVPQYFNTSTNKWYAIEETYDVDLDEYTYTFDTSSDGITWAQVASYDTSQGLTFFSLDTDIYAVQATGGRPIYKSSNGGASFSNVGNLPSALTVLAFCVNIDNVAYVCGQSAGNAPRVQYTTNGTDYTTVDLPFSGTITGLVKHNDKFFVQIFNTGGGTVDTYYCDALSASGGDYDASDSYSYTVFGQATVGLNEASGKLIHTFSVPSGSDGQIKTKVLADASIAPLSTILTGIYDFAQSVI